MAEKDASSRLRRAVKENNLFLVKRLIQRTDMRNPDIAPRRFTSLAWAAVLGHEETFEFLLCAGHDDDELSKDADNNTILMLLAEHKPPYNPYAPQSSSQDSNGATLRMARMYYERYPEILDWSNVQGKTALHIAALKGNEELVRMFCDIGADVDLADNKGNTPLHYASSWGHIPIVQLLIERGCQYVARNNEGFTPSDYAYSFSTRDTLEDTARLQYENNKKMRRQIFAQAAERGNEWGGSTPIGGPPPVPVKDRNNAPRLRSGSGTSRTTATSDSGDLDSIGSSIGIGATSSSLSSQQPSNSMFYQQSLAGYHTSGHSSSSTGTFSPPSKTSTLPGLSVNPASALSPIANRMRERDADAMEKYLMRNRSGSSSTDNKSQNGSNYSSAGPSANGDDISALNQHIGGITTPKRLRPSVSAAQLRNTAETTSSTKSAGPPESRTRAGTNPTALRPSMSPIPLLTRSSSTSNSLRSINSGEHDSFEEHENYTGPPSQYAQFPEPPLADDSSTPTVGRRKAFHLLSKPLHGVDSSASHRRGMSATAVRGA